MFFWPIRCWVIGTMDQWGAESRVTKHKIVSKRVSETCVWIEQPTLNSWLFWNDQCSSRLWDRSIDTRQQTSDLGACFSYSGMNCLKHDQRVIVSRSQRKTQPDRADRKKSKDNTFEVFLGKTRHSSFLISKLWNCPKINALSTNGWMPDLVYCCIWESK